MPYLMIKLFKDTLTKDIVSFEQLALANLATANCVDWAYSVYQHYMKNLELVICSLQVIVAIFNSVDLPFHLYLTCHTIFNNMT